MFLPGQVLRVVTQYQQSFEIASGDLLRPAQRRQQGSVFGAIGAHRSQGGLRSPVFSVIGVNQLIADVIIEGSHLLAGVFLTLRELVCQGYDLWIGGFDVQLGLGELIRQLPLAGGQVVGQLVDHEPVIDLDHFGCSGWMVGEVELGVLVAVFVGNESVFPGGDLKR